jgi:hypothetical protein
MNSTNRIGNRILLLVAGLALVLVGVVTLLRPLLTRLYGPSWFPDLLPVVTGQETAWTSSVPTLLEVAAICVLLAALLAAFIARQGRGGSTLIVDTRNARAGGTVLEVGLARQLLEKELNRHGTFLAVHVSAHRVRGVVLLKCSLESRRGMDPAVSTAVAVEALEALDAVLGRSLPTFIGISSGFRSRLVRRTRGLPPAGAWDRPGDARPRELGAAGAAPLLPMGTGDLRPWIGSRIRDRVRPMTPTPAHVATGLAARVEARATAVRNDDSDTVGAGDRP